ncbi:hypothetical protein ACFQ1S_13465 [Kibdelosporangium lantanae]|uniref:Uncharacterized protein n=1 Tax=Kibdelosporangium lantanae TaxID=1497396 RepID=A0ABW3MA02_9PSEU
MLSATLTADTFEPALHDTTCDVTTPVVDTDVDSAGDVETTGWLLTAPEAGYGTAVGLSLVGFLVFAVTSAKWRARYRETRRTGWRRGYATPWTTS